MGNFQHTPNIDAVLWFIEEVMPIVIQKIPGFEFWVVGDNPPSSLTSITSPTLFIKGWVKDLDALLNQMRLNVAPLRFGAGVKGKISHALSIGLPTVTTSIGAEGMSLANSIDVEIADTPEAFAEKICLLMHNDQHWSDISQAGQLSAEKLFGLDHARKILTEILV